MKKFISYAAMDDDGQCKNIVSETRIAAAARIFRERPFSSSSRVAHNGKRAAIKFTTWPRWLSCIYSWSFPRGSSRNFRVEWFYTSMIFLLLFLHLHWLKLIFTITKWRRSQRFINISSSKYFLFCVSTKSTN